jgi:tetratricopeptide (TPR) repeat protein
MFQQSLAIAYANTAGALSNMGRKAQSLNYVESSEKIMRALFASAPQNVQQHGTFAAIVATNGVTLLNLGKPESALKKLEEARSRFSYLRGNAPIDAGGPIMTCTEKMGEAVSRAGDSKLAEEYFNEVSKAAEPAMRAQRANLDELYLLAASYSGLGDLQLQKARDYGKSLTERRVSLAQAQSFYQKSLDAWHLIKHPLHTGPLGFEYGDPTRVGRKLRICESTLALLEAIRR